MKVGKHFSYEPLPGWEESSDGVRHLYRGPEGEELTVSAWFVDRDESLRERQKVERQLFENAATSARRAALDPRLTVIKPFDKEDDPTPLPCWTIFAETTERDILFLQAVLTSPEAVLLATLEAPSCPDSIDVFRGFLKTIRTP